MTEDGLTSIKIVNRRPFKHLCMTIGNLPEAFVDSMSYYEALAWIVNYMEKDLIPALNNNAEAVDELQDAYVQLKNYVDNYFSNLNVQDEINAKLDQMATDGTLADIINQEIFGELNEKVTELQKTKINNKIFLATFFNPTTKKIEFSTSLDGINFADILPDVDLTGRDPQISYSPVTKKFYICTTGGSTDSVDGRIYVSEDLKNWETKYFNVGLLSGIRWAPELFFDDNGDVYLFINRGTDQSSMQIYKARCTSLEDLTFSPAVPISLDETNMIDANVIKYRGTYYLCTKNNTTSQILIYSSADLINWTCINRNVLRTTEPCEGGTLVPVGNKVNFYGDTWHSYKYYVMAQTSDLSQFSAFKRPNSLIGKRHGSVAYIEDSAAVSLISSLETYTNRRNLNKATTREIQLSGDIDQLIIYPNIVYRVTATARINSLVNAFGLDYMPFYFATNNSASLTISKVQNSEFQTVNLNKTVFNSVGENEKLNLLSLIGNPKFLINPGVTKLDTSTIAVNNGWKLEIYGFDRRGDRVFVNFDISKTDESATGIALVFPNNARPKYNTIGISNKPNIGYQLSTNGNFGVNGYSTLELNSRRYFSLEYYSPLN